MAVVNGNRDLAWFTSSYSNGAGGECVECALTGGRALVRDSKWVEGSEIAVGSAAWLPFMRFVKRDDEVCAL